MQAYVNDPRLVEKLNAAIGEGVPSLAGAQFEWLSPLSSAKYSELSDKRFWSAIDRNDLGAAAAGWWPSGGPVWDAVAVVTTADAVRHVVLVEAKANVREFEGGGMAATSPRSITMIDAALEATRSALSSTAPLTAWKGPHYQLANRLAWTKWLGDHGQSAVFAHLLFTEDTTHISATEDQLLAAATASREALGVPSSALDSWTTTVVLPAT